jgi:DNA-binding winged helix-turn-helix (wHTH) protein
MDEPTAHLVYEFGDFQVDTTQRLLILKSSGRTLPLSSRAFDALVYFLEHRGQLLEKSALMAAIWPKVVVEENNLNQHISALRRLLGESRDDHRFIVTVPGRGYRFVADVIVRDRSRPAALLPPDPEP